MNPPRPLHPPHPLEPKGQASSATSVAPVAAAAATTATTATLTRRIRLIKTHIHAGLPHKVGDEIELHSDLADWLIAEGAAVELAAPSANVVTAAAIPVATQ